MQKLYFIPKKWTLLFSVYIYLLSTCFVFLKVYHFLKRITHIYTHVNIECWTNYDHVRLINESEIAGFRLGTFHYDCISNLIRQRSGWNSIWRYTLTTWVCNIKRRSIFEKTFHLKWNILTTIKIFNAITKTIPL